MTALACCGLESNAAGENPADANGGWTLWWHDEFDGDRIDARKWKATDRAHVDHGAVRLPAWVESDGRLGRSQISTGQASGRDRFQRHAFAPPVRIELRFQPAMKPGSFIALWMMHHSWNHDLYADDKMMVGKEFDFLECGGGENIVTDDDIQMVAHMAVHAWRAPRPWVPGGHQSCQVNVKPRVSVGNPVGWQEMRIDWDDASRPGGRELRYYWRASGEAWGEPRLVLRPQREFFAPNHRMNQVAFADVRHVDLLEGVWDEPMHLILFNVARAPDGWLSQESLAENGENTWSGDRLDPSDFPVEVPIDYVRIFVPEDDRRLKQ